MVTFSGLAQAGKYNTSAQCLHIAKLINYRTTHKLPLACAKPLLCAVSKSTLMWLIFRKAELLQNIVCLIHFFLEQGLVFILLVQPVLNGEAFG